MSIPGGGGCYGILLINDNSTSVTHVWHWDTIKTDSFHFWVPLVCMSTTWVQVPIEVKSIRPSGTGVRDRCKSMCRYWVLNPCTLQKQKVFLSAKPSLQLQTPGFYLKHPHWFYNCCTDVYTRSLAKEPLSYWFLMDSSIAECSPYVGSLWRTGGLASGLRPSAD